MLSAAYKSIYKQYKSDTDSVATWLATTAKAHGYGAEAPKEESGSAPKLKKTPKKGKGKSKGKPKHKKPKEESQNSEGKYVIKVRDFEAMAKHVADTNAVEVPHQTAVALERGIWVRRSFSQQLRRSGVSRDRRSDATHAHFVEVLEKVRDFLKPIMQAGLFEPADLNKESKGAKHPIKNMFDVLNVYTPSEDFLNAPDIVPTPAEDKPVYTIQETDTFEDAVIAFIALLREYESLTEEVRALWTKYSAGKLDLAVVSVATNTAFEIAHSMENESKDLLDKFGTSGKLANIFFQQYCDTVGIDWSVKQPGELFNPKAYHLAKPLYVDTLGVLVGYQDGSRNTDIINSYNGKFGWYDENVGAMGASNKQKWTQDSTAMMEVLPDLQYLSTSGTRGPIEDELLCGIGTMFNGPARNPPLWLSWGFRVYLDILQGAGKNCGHAYQQMKQESLKIQKALLDIPHSPQREKVLKAAMQWNVNPIWTARKEMHQRGLCQVNPPEFTFLRRHPIHCGLLIHHMRSVLHISGVEAAAHSGGLMVTTQLYHALQQEQRLADAQWEDLETFWKFQGNPCFFVGDPPKDREGYFRNYTLSLGLSATNWATNRRDAKPVQHKDNARNMKFDGWVSLSLNNRIVPDNPREPWSAATVETLLTEGRHKETLDGKGHVQVHLKGKGKEAKVSANLARLKSFTNIDQQDPVPKTPCGVIDELAQVLQREMPRIAFNYFNMHDIAWKLLTHLKEAFTKAHGPEFLQYVPTENELPFVVGYVFSTASGHGSTDVRESGLGNESLLDIAATVVREFLEQGNGRLITETSKKHVEPEDVEGIDIINGLWHNKHRSREMDAMAAATNMREIRGLVEMLSMLRG
ncbi:hypothetical protein FHETE_1662 [Fusarium heterosporum]|uniref:DUF6604 domain-containing protein n=1 Tax=Fusarium heterosporum TaxID=42747 RepID=A0A8H5WZB1_FUSHE|nr:hypothetical protein FHETE_1662 [Fusarium heterosporum]